MGKPLWWTKSKASICSDWCVSIGWALYHKAKGRQFNSYPVRAHDLGCGGLGDLQEATDPCSSCTSLFVSLSFSLPFPYLKINKILKKNFFKASLCSVLLISIVFWINRYLKCNQGLLGLGPNLSAQAPSSLLPLPIRWSSQSPLTAIPHIYHVTICTLISIKRFPSSQTSFPSSFTSPNPILLQARPHMSPPHSTTHLILAVLP